MTSRELARNLMADFVIQFRAGGNDVSENWLVQVLEAEMMRGKTTFDTLRPNVLWGYYHKRTLQFQRNKAWAEDCADGFIWDNPRVRKVGIFYPQEAIK